MSIEQNNYSYSNETLQSPKLFKVKSIRVETNPLIDFKIDKNVDVNEIMENLKNGVGNIFNNKNFVKYLDFQSKFHNYSPNNNLLIAIQNPNATNVASFVKWKSLGRTINKDEKGIVILAPNVVNLGTKQILEKINKEGFIKIGKYTFAKKDNLYKININGKTVKKNLSEKEFKSFLDINKIKGQILIGFRKAYVFDISQTSGREVPQFKAPKLDDKELLTNKGFYKMPYVEILSSESNVFKEGQLLAFTAANKIFKEQEAKIRNLKEEYALKEEYYPYEKVKFRIHFSPTDKESFRFDIGDGYSNDLCHFVKNNIMMNLKFTNETNTFNTLNKKLDCLVEPLGIQKVENISFIEKINIWFEKMKEDNSLNYESKTEFLLSPTGDIIHTNLNNSNKEYLEKGFISIAKLQNPFNLIQFEKNIQNTINKLDDEIAFSPQFDKSMATILGIKDEIENCIKNKNIHLEFIPDTGSANGYFAPNENKICVNGNMVLSQTTKTLTHEYVHSQLHKDGAISKDNLSGRQTAEIEAEATTYVVSKHFGFDTSNYSFDYVSSWARGKEICELEETLKTIKNTAEKIINEIKSPIELQLYNNKENIVEILKSENIKPNEKIINTMIDINKETGKINTVSDLTNAEKFKSYSNNEDLSLKISDTNKEISNNTIVVEKTIKTETEIEIER